MYKNLDKRAKEVLRQAGYDIDISIYKPGKTGYLTCEILKDKMLMFRSEFEDGFSGDEYDTQGTNVIDECLGMRKDRGFVTQIEKFLQARDQAVNGNPGLLGSKRRKYQAECEALMEYTAEFNTSKTRDAVYVNIPMFLDSEEELKKLKKQIKEACVEKPLEREA